MGEEKTSRQNWRLIYLPGAGAAALALANFALRRRAWATASVAGHEGWQFLAKPSTLITLAVTAALTYLLVNCLASYWIGGGQAGQNHAPEKLSADTLFFWAATALFGLFSAVTAIEGRLRVSIWMLLAGGALVQMPLRWLFHDRYGARGTLVFLLMSGALFFWVLIWGVAAAQVDAKEKAEIKHHQEHGAPANDE